MRLNSLAVLVGFASVLAVSNASAVKIDGGVAWSSTYMPVESDGVTAAPLALADGLLIDSPGGITSTTGDFVSILGTASISSPIPTTFTSPFVFDPYNPASDNFVWMAPDGAPVASFTLETLMIQNQTPQMLVLLGTGILSADGYDDTPADFALTVSQDGADFTISGVNNSIPDGGTTVGLLGLTLVGLGLGRRLMRK